MEVHVLNTLDIIMLISLFSLVTLHHYMTSYSNVDHVLTLLNDMTHAPDPVAYAPDPLTYAPNPLTHAPDPLTYAPYPLSHALDLCPSDSCS